MDRIEVTGIGAVPEMPFWLEVNGRRVGSWTCSPGHFPALAVGWLLAEGYVDPREGLPLLELVEEDGPVGIRSTLRAERALQGDLERRHRREHGCGLLFFIRCAPDRIRRRSVPAPAPDATAMPGLFRALYATDDGDRRPGGVHVAALAVGQELLFRTEEVGRHNAVDKVIGRAILAGTDPAEFGLVLSARVSGEIALKAARAGVRWIASRSVPTTLAIEIAAAAGVPILARAASREPRLHASEGTEVDR